jgi:hypothetical protein
MRQKPFLWAALALGLGLVSAVPVRADTVLWYNGDADGANSYTNQDNGQAQQVIYSQFNTLGGWLVTRVWSNDIFSNGPPASTTASWEIRANMPTGALIASGDSPATLTPTGFTVNGLPEYTVQVSGLNVALTPGTYWLAVYPDNTNGGIASNDTTSGANAIGTPPGNGDTYLWKGSGHPTPPGPSFSDANFNTSAGVGGLQVPELGGHGQEAVLAMAALVLGLVLVVRPAVRRRLLAPASRS